jgi:uncharacterized protein YebE (UPF0316 family)
MINKGDNMELFLLCLTIFFARIVDVCLGTFRISLIVKGKKTYATFISFIEVLIWYLIAREAITTDIKSIFIPIAFAGGFATGTLIGMFLSSVFIGGHLTLNIISTSVTEDDIKLIKKKGFGVSILEMQDDKKMLIIGIDKKRLNELKQLMSNIDENAFIITNETKYVQNGFIK